MSGAGSRGWVTRLLGSPRAGSGLARPRLAELGLAALDLVVPQACAGCGEPGCLWCPACRAECRGPSLLVPCAVPCVAAAPHASALGRAVVAFKDDGARRLSGPLGELLAGAVLDLLRAHPAQPGQPVWLVPVPSRRSARRERGADHMAVLAARAARGLRSAGVPAHRIAALRHVRASSDQVGLGRSERRANVAGTLAGLPVPPGMLVVVDDVTTTGATLAEAVRALRAVDGRPAAAATLTWAQASR